MRELFKLQQELEDNLKTVEDQIYDLETNYLESTSGSGNVVHGWGSSLEPKASTSRAQQVKRDRRVRLEDRIFSLSSVTSQASKEALVHAQEEYANPNPLGAINAGGKDSSTNNVDDVQILGSDNGDVIDGETLGKRRTSSSTSTNSLVSSNTWKKGTGKPRHTPSASSLSSTAVSSANKPRAHSSKPRSASTSASASSSSSTAGTSQEAMTSETNNVASMSSAMKPSSSSLSTDDVPSPDTTQYTPSGSVPASLAATSTATPGGSIKRKKRKSANFTGSSTKAKRKKAAAAKQ